MVDPFASQATDTTQNQQDAVKNTDGIKSFSADDVFGGNPDVFADMEPSAFQPIDPVTGQAIDHTQETLDPFLRDGEALAAPSHAMDTSADNTFIPSIDEEQHVVVEDTANAALKSEKVDASSENITDLDAQPVEQDSSAVDQNDDDPFLRTDGNFQETETSDDYDPFVSDIDQQPVSPDTTLDQEDVSSPLATEDDNQEETQATTDTSLDSSSDAIDPQAIADMENVLMEDFDSDAAKQAMMDIHKESVSPDLPIDTVDTKEDTQDPSMVQGLVDSFVDPFLQPTTPEPSPEQEAPVDGSEGIDAPKEDMQEISDTDLVSSLSGSSVLDEEEKEEQDEEIVAIDPVVSAEQTVDESVNDTTRVDGRSDLVEKFSALQKAIYHVYDYQEQEGEFAIVGSDNDMLYVTYVFALSADEQEIIVSKEHIDKKTDHTENHIMRFVLTPSSDLEVFVDDVLLFSESALVDDVKSKMQLLDKFNKFIFLVNTHADSLAESHRIAEDTAITQEAKDAFQQF